MSSPAPYPVRIEASLDPAVSRWLWLVKWLLAIPHYVLLGLLWVAFTVLGIVAFFAILVTGRYPRGIFDFNVGVLRWTWRVQYYAYFALGTDRYPPFTLDEVPDYPAHLDVDYPERLSRGLVLVKWWLLAIPHYVIVALFVGGGSWYAWQSGNATFGWAAGGLVGILVLVVAIVLLFTGSYPRSIFDFILGMDRWVFRVIGYAALMTDKYPPFRLDMGGPDPAGPLAAPRPTAPAGTTVPGRRYPAQRHWTGGRIASVIAGALLVLVSAGLLTGGATLLWADRADRGADGYLTVSDTLAASGYAVTTQPVALLNWTPGAASGVGDVRVRVTPADPGRAVFVGVAPAAAADRYLSGVDHAVLRDSSSDRMTVYHGGPPAMPPAATGIWVAEASGTGTQTITVPLRPGEWAAVVMNADAAPGIDARAEVGATAPGLGWFSAVVIALGVVLLAGGVALIAVPVHRASREMRSAGPAQV